MKKGAKHLSLSRVQMVAKTVMGGQGVAENSKLHIRSERGDRLMSQKKYSLLYPDINARYRTLSDVTMHDLGMDQLCKKLSAKEREQNYI